MKILIVDDHAMIRTGLRQLCADRDAAILEADNGRTALARLIVERGEDYAGLSRLIGRNAAYIQQFIKRGSPRRLAEADRRILARYFGVEEAVLGAPETEPGAGLRPVPRLDVDAAAGAGAFDGDERGGGHIAFEPDLWRWARTKLRDSILSTA